MNRKVMCVKAVPLPSSHNRFPCETTLNTNR